VWHLPHPFELIPQAEVPPRTLEDGIDDFQMAARLRNDYLGARNASEIPMSDFATSLFCSANCSPVVQLCPFVVGARFHESAGFGALFALRHLEGQGRTHACAASGTG
jgi:hypothetical protein